MTKACVEWTSLKSLDFGPESDQGPMAGKLGRRRAVAPSIWEDLATAWRTTGIGDITSYMTASPWQVRLLPVLLPMLRALLAPRSMGLFLRSRVSRRGAGPTPASRRTDRTRVRGRDPRQVSDRGEPSR